MPADHPNCDAGSEVWGQRYDSDGSRRAANFTSTQYTTAADRRGPRVGLDAAGNFVVTWLSYGQPASSTTVLAPDASIPPEYLGTSSRRQHDRPRAIRCRSESPWSSDRRVHNHVEFHQNDVPPRVIRARRYEAYGRPRGRRIPAQRGHDHRDRFLSSSPATSVAVFVIAWKCAELGGHCDGSYDAVRARRGGIPNARPMSVDASVKETSPAGGSNLNGVLEAEELVAVRRPGTTTAAQICR